MLQGVLWVGEGTLRANPLIGSLSIKAGYIYGLDVNQRSMHCNNFTPIEKTSHAFFMEKLRVVISF